MNSSSFNVSICYRRRPTPADLVESSSSAQRNKQDDPDDTQVNDAVARRVTTLNGRGSLPGCSVAAGDQARLSRSQLTSSAVPNSKCKYHIPNIEWRDQEQQTRPGWIRTTCRRCGSFIGYRPR